MYCTACGSYSSDAGGHVCAEPETAVLSTATATVAPDPTATWAARTAPSATPPAGWHPDPNDPALVRYWDGSSWTEHTAWAAATSTIGSGAYGGQQDGTHGRYLGALPRTVGRRGRFDVLVYEKALVFARVPGTDPATLGFLAGFFTVSGLIGYIVGDYIGAGGNAARIDELSRLSPAEIAARHKHSAVVPTSTITGGEITTCGTAIGRMKLRTASGTTWKRRWTRPHTKNVNPGFLLGAALGPHVPIQRRSPWRAHSIPITLVAVLVGLFVLGSLGNVFVSATERARQQAGIDEVRPTCQAIVDLNDRAVRGEQPDPQELVVAIRNLVGPMQGASDESDTFDPAFAAVTRLDGFLPTWDGVSQPPETFERDLGVVLNTCAAATA